MAASTIVTGQFVRIRQTPASVGDRFLALLIDIVLIIIYELAMYAITSRLELGNTGIGYFFLFILFAAPFFYFLLCEVFNRGQTIGKYALHIRVVKADGSTPSLSSYLLRWILFPIDFLLTGGVGVLSIILTRNNQRLGDLAAGTIVIKEKNYKRIQVSLDEFDFLTKGYRPVYAQAVDLSLEQINVITKTLAAEKDRSQRIEQLGTKVRAVLSIKSNDVSSERFLETLLRDYQYYALEEI